MITDHSESLWVKLAEFTQEEKNILKEWLPDASSVSNPIDIIWDATSERYWKILENIKKLEKKRAILVMLTPQTVTDSDKIADIIVEFKKNNPDFYVMASFMWDASLLESRKILNNKDVLDFTFPQKAMLAFSRILKQKRWEEKSENNSRIQLISDFSEVKNILKTEKKLAWPKSVEQICEVLDLPNIKNYLVKSEKEAEEIFDKIGAKKLLARISSEDIPHKTDVWGVVFDITDSEKSKNAYNTILKNIEKNAANAKIEWVIYSTFLEQWPDLREIFVWFKRDATFWNILIVWMWGIYVNVYEDVTRRILPISREEIIESFKELKWYKILSWYRWTKSIDFEKVSDIILKFSELFNSLEEIKEIDINPLFADEENSYLVDVKLYL